MLKLDDLKVQSFVTELNDHQKKAINGGLQKATTECILRTLQVGGCDNN
jgi:hypothetical protein